MCLVGSFFGKKGLFFELKEGCHWLSIAVVVCELKWQKKRTFFSPFLQDPFLPFSSLSLCIEEKEEGSWDSSGKSRAPSICVCSKSRRRRREEIKRLYLLLLLCQKGKGAVHVRRHSILLCTYVSTYHIRNRTVRKAKSWKRRERCGSLAQTHTHSSLQKAPLLLGLWQQKTNCPPPPHSFPLRKSLYLQNDDDDDISGEHLREENTSFW